MPAQREACQRKAAGLGAEVVGKYVDRGESAKTADRPQLKALLYRLKSERDLDYVIVHKVDRLARNRYDDATITYALHRAGVEVVSVTENIDDTPVGRSCTRSSPPTPSSTRPSSPPRLRRASSRRRRLAAPRPAPHSATSTSAS
ncbi:MAG: recombinase family protein [Thermoleophilaceae bacterium]